jgi:hypothetical protein
MLIIEAYQKIKRKRLMSIRTTKNFVVKKHSKRRTKIRRNAVFEWRKHTAGEEYMPELRANTTKGSGFTMENFFCSSDTFNFWSARSKD